MSSCQPNCSYSVPKKPPRHYLPLSLSEWDVRARERRRQQAWRSGANHNKCTHRSCSLDPKLLEFEDIAQSSARSSSPVILRGTTFMDVSCKARITEESNLRWKKRPISMLDDRHSEIIQNFIFLKCSGIDSTVSAPLPRSYRRSFTNKLVEHSQSFAKLFGTLRLRSKSTTKRNERVDIPIANEQPRVIPLPGENLAWLQSQGFGIPDEDDPFSFSEAIRRRSKSVGPDSKDSDSICSIPMKLHEEHFLMIHPMENTLCTRL